MQILHFDWLRYCRSISNSHRVAKFAGFVNLFISFYSQIYIYFLLNLLLLFFCPTSWVILKQLEKSFSNSGAVNWIADPSSCSRLTPHKAFYSWLHVFSHQVKFSIFTHSTRHVKQVLKSSWSFRVILE